MRAGEERRAGAGGEGGREWGEREGGCRAPWGSGSGGPLRAGLARCGPTLGLSSGSGGIGRDCSTAQLSVRAARIA